MSRRQPVVERLGSLRLLGFTPGEWLPAGLVALLAAQESLLGSGAVAGPRLANAVAGVVAALLLLWRRRTPVFVLLGAAAVLMIPALIWGASEFASAALTVAVAVYACGRYGRRPVAFVAPCLGAGAVLLQLALDPLSSVGAGWLWALNTLWIFGLGMWVSQRKALADRARTEYEARAAVAAAEDRIRTARDVHDILAHNLAVMLVQADAADELLDSDPVRAHRALANVHQTGRSAMADVRGLLDALRSQSERGTPDARTPGSAGVDRIPHLVDRVRDSGLPVTLVTVGDVDRVGEQTGMIAYRVVQEALTNVLRHAGPANTEVSLTITGTDLRIGVRDHGLPGSGKPIGAGPAGQGLRGMRERVVARGGTLRAGPDAGGGFTVAVALPLPEQAPGGA